MPQTFEDPEAMYRVLTNGRNQHCLWPVFANVPSGWTEAYGPSRRAAALAFVRENWTDLRPTDVSAAADRSSAGTAP